MNKDLLYLENILESARLIGKYARDKQSIDLEHSILLKDAISKRIEEIGENMNKVSSTLKRKNKEVKWQDFIGSRNFLSHIYQMVNVNKLWNIIVKEIPVLEKQIKEIIKEVKK
jgi:uncharacterized protein with HEPN domain